MLQRDVRLPYEDRVTSETFSQEPVEAQLASWNAYIKLELGAFVFVWMKN